MSTAGVGVAFGYGYSFSGWSRDYPKPIASSSRRSNASPESDALLRTGGRSRQRRYLQLSWVYAVQVANWTFTDTEAKRLREYLLKGGFLMVDDFHGTDDWERFMPGMRQVLPAGPVADLSGRG